MIENPSNFSDQFKNFIEHIALTIKNGLNDKLSINEQTLSEKEKTQVKNNIGLPAEIAALKQVLASKSELSNYLLTTGKAASASTADTAYTAINDGSGNNINNTYIKSVSVYGRTVTFTRGNGTTFSIVTQDTVTTNTSNWSASDGINGWARDNSTGFTVQWGELGYPNNSSRDVYFPRSFRNTSYQVELSFRKGSYADNRGCILTWERVSHAVVRISGGTQSSFTGCSYIAVGFS